MAERKKHKDWFDDDLAHLLADKVEVTFPEFPRKKLVVAIKKGIPNLEIKGRIELFADELKALLPPDYAKALPILIGILGDENPNETGMFTEFYWAMPIAKFVEKYGLDNYSISVKALAEVTKRNTSEYAIRPYIEKYPEKTIKQMLKWSKNKNFHLRRLASEGGRPRLPWASKIDQFIDNPTPLLPILENLKSDQVKFVQKSVANCINDILKDNYEIAMDLLRGWTKNPSLETKWIIKHALRKELKKGNREAENLVS